MEYATHDGLVGFTILGPKTWAEVPRRNGATRGGIMEVASRRSKSVKKACPSERVGPLRPQVCGSS